MRRGYAALAAVAAGFGAAAALALCHGPAGGVAQTAGTLDAAPAITRAPEPRRLAGASYDSGPPSTRPVPRLSGTPKYGRNPDSFIRQRHDYPPDTPEKLGPKIGRYLFDLERVKEVVRLGNRPDSELARARGAPLSEASRAAARRELQAFFDEVTPIVDAVLAGDLSHDRALQQIRTRRRALDRELGHALGLDLAEILPHLAERD